MTKISSVFSPVCIPDHHLKYGNSYLCFVKTVLSHISILLILLIAIGLSWQTFTIIHFYSNQDEIEAEHCINKDKPEMNCHAQCHLNKQLKPAIIDRTESGRTIQINGILAFQLFEDVQHINFASIEGKTYSNFQNSFLLKDGHLLAQLDPPEIG